MRGKDASVHLGNFNWLALLSGAPSSTIGKGVLFRSELAFPAVITSISDEKIAKARHLGVYRLTSYRTTHN